MEQARNVSYSRTTQTYLLMKGHLNVANVLFGGQLLSWIDMLAGIVALRHCDCQVVTAAIDHLEFLCPAYAGDVLTMDGRVTWVGNTSMEVRVDTYRENRGGVKHLMNTAYLVMVAVSDETGKPCAIRKLHLETDEEKAEWEAAEKRSQLRKLRRKEHY